MAELQRLCIEQVGGRQWPSFPQLISGTTWHVEMRWTCPGRLAAVQLLQSPETVRKARQEFDSRRGTEFRYRPLLQRDTPPRDYRSKAAR